MSQSITQMWIAVICHCCHHNIPLVCYCLLRETIDLLNGIAYGWHMLFFDIFFLIFVQHRPFCWSVKAFSMAWSVFFRVGWVSYLCHFFWSWTFSPFLAFFIIFSIKVSIHFLWNLSTRNYTQAKRWGLVDEGFSTFGCSMKSARRHEGDFIFVSIT